MLFEFFNHNSLLSSTSIDESFGQVRLKISNSDHSSTYILKLFDELKTISERDSFQLFVDISGTTVDISDCSSSSYKKIENHLDSYDATDEFDVEVIIRKNLHNSKLSIYFFDYFCDFLSKKNLKDSLRNFDNFFTESLYFEVFSTFEPFGTSTIQFYETNQNYKQTCEVGRDDKLELLFQNTNNSDYSARMLPSDFNLLKESENTSINNFFVDICNAMSLTFLSNSSVIKDNSIDYKINGYKTISCSDVKLKDLRENSHLYDIYDWTYVGGNNTDKLGLVRNLLSLNLDKSGSAIFDGKVWDAIRSNYQIYLKGNIQSYLDVKNKIGEIIIDSTTKTYEMVDGLLESLKNNVLILLTFILTVIVVNGLKDNGYKRIFSDEYTGIVIIISVVSAFWLLMYSVELIRRYDNATDTIKKILRLNYNDILIDSEIEKSINPVVEDNRAYLKKQIQRYAFWWMFILILFVSLYVLSNRYFSNDVEVDIDNHQEEVQQRTSTLEKNRSN